MLNVVEKVICSCRSNKFPEYNCLDIASTIAVGEISVLEGKRINRFCM